MASEVKNENGNGNENETTNKEGMSGEEIYAKLTLGI